ncbi:ribonuclease H-like domain-containing protein [Tanacetum coccineum]
MDLLLLIIIFLMGLDDSYMQIRSSILSREALPDVRSAYATITSEKSHRVASGSISDALRSLVTLLILEKKKPRQNVKGKNISNNNSVGSSSSSGFTDEQMSTFISLIKDNKVGKNVHANMPVGHPNGTEAFISKIGNLRLPNGLVLFDVLVVPEYCVTLIYVHKLAKDNKIFVVFDESRCYFLNLKNVTGIDFVAKKDDTLNVFQDLNHINFFDNDYPEIPNDDERVDPNLNSDYSDDIFATQDEQVTTLEDNIISEGDLDQNLNFFTHGTQTVRIEPKSFFEAYKFSHWTDAMNNEIDASLRNDTWEIFDLLKDRKAIGSKWIFKIKYKSIGEIDRYKARLVTQGFGQNKGIDYEETFSPVVKMVTVRCLLNIVVSNSWPVFQLDVNNVFLYGDLVETVYMKPPKGYFPSDNKVCRLKKSLYGLKQASRQWNAKLTYALIENGFSQSKSDYSPYTKSDKGVFLALLVYVDDIIITGNSISEIDKFKVFLKSKFMTKDLGKLKYFLGIEVIDTDKGICLNQRKYVLDLLSEYGMLACKPAKTHLMSKLAISNEATDDDLILDNITDYQKLLGKLIYLTNTRPDISYAVDCLSQFMHSPLKSHLKIAFNKKQNTLSKSLTEAEYRALASVTTIKIAVSHVFHERTKHLEIDLSDVVKTVKVDSAN